VCGVGKKVLFKLTEQQDYAADSGVHFVLSYEFPVDSLEFGGRILVEPKPSLTVREERQVSPT
jgi:hypothetical protein